MWNFISWTIIIGGLVAIFKFDQLPAVKKFVKDLFSEKNFFDHDTSAIGEVIDLPEEEPTTASSEAPNQPDNQHQE